MVLVPTVCDCGQQPMQTLHHPQAANVLIDHNGHIFIADFTIATQLERSFDASTVEMLKAEGFTGTIAWMAPEIVEGLGCGLLCCLCVWEYTCVAGIAQRRVRELRNAECKDMCHLGA